MTYAILQRKIKSIICANKIKYIFCLESCQQIVGCEFCFMGFLLRFSIGLHLHLPGPAKLNHKFYILLQNYDTAVQT